MIIAVVGLGLIGGSICKTLKKHTDHTVLGLDLNEETALKAKSCGAVDDLIGVQKLGAADMTFICLHPKDTVEFVLNNINSFSAGSIVSDVCGVKQFVTSALEAPLSAVGVNFVGTHPMAGREFSGFDYTSAELFDNASFIITKTETLDLKSAKIVKNLAEGMKFKEVIISTPEEHDRNIAFTSQLAHVVSNAYIKSPRALSEHGFSAGSFLDLTRVAKLNAPMWAELFIANAENLSGEIETIIKNLSQYKNALDGKDERALETLLKQGSEIKERTLEQKIKPCFCL